MPQNDLTLIFDLIYSGIFFGSLSYLYFFLYPFFFTNSTLNLTKIMRQITYNKYTVQIINIKKLNNF